MLLVLARTQFSGHTLLQRRLGNVVCWVPRRKEGGFGKYLVVSVCQRWTSLREEQVEGVLRRAWNSVLDKISLI